MKSIHFVYGFILQYNQHFITNNRYRKETVLYFFFL